jgi:integrase
MRPEEMFEEHGNAWSVDEIGIRIHGTKSPAADRVVPRIGILVKPDTGRLAFYRALRTANGKTVAPYDLRRTYAQWLDLARIPQLRQDYYMAHGPKDLNALYKRTREVSAALHEDAAALGRLVGEPVVLRMVK